MEADLGADGAAGPSGRYCVARSMSISRQNLEGGRSLDSIELRTLRDEMRNDSRVIADAYAKAVERFERNDMAGNEACAHQLARMYNAFEKMGLRIAKAFENSIDDEKGSHSGLLNRLGIRIEGVRPAVIPSELKLPLHELRGFRHVFVHAYELELDREKLKLLLKYAAQVSDGIHGMIEDFASSVAREQNIPL